MQSINFSSVVDPFKALFQRSFQEDLQQRLRHVLCEALMYPADEEWLAEQLADVYGYANNTRQRKKDQVIQVKVVGQGVRLYNSTNSIFLEWRAFWQQKGERNQSIAELSKTLHSLTD